MLSWALYYKDKKHLYMVDGLISKTLLNKDAMHRLLSIGNPPTHNPPNSANWLRAKINSQMQAKLTN